MLVFHALHQRRPWARSSRHGHPSSPRPPLCTAATVTGPTASNPAVVCRRGRCAQAWTVCVCMYVCVFVCGAGASWRRSSCDSLVRTCSVASHVVTIHSPTHAGIRSSAQCMLPYLPSWCWVFCYSRLKVRHPEGNGVFRMGRDRLGSAPTGLRTFPLASDGFSGREQLLPGRAEPDFNFSRKFSNFPNSGRAALKQHKTRAKTADFYSCCLLL